jgi:hypothetical protein
MSSPLKDSVSTNKEQKAAVLFSLHSGSMSEPAELISEPAEELSDPAKDTSSTPGKDGDARKTSGTEASLQWGVGAIRISAPQKQEDGDVVEAQPGASSVASSDSTIGETNRLPVDVERLKNDENSEIVHEGLRQYRDTLLKERELLVQEYDHAQAQLQTASPDVIAGMAKSLLEKQTLLDEVNLDIQDVIGVIEEGDWEEKVHFMKEINPDVILQEPPPPEELRKQPQDPCEVVVEKSNFGFGVQFAESENGQVVVNKFNKLKDGSDGALKKTGRVEVGDIMVSINDIVVIGTSFPDVVGMLRGTPPGELVRFRFYRINSTTPPKNFSDFMSPNAKQSLFNAKSAMASGASTLFKRTKEALVVPAPAPAPAPVAALPKGGRESTEIETPNQTGKEPAPAATAVGTPDAVGATGSSSVATALTEEPKLGGGAEGEGSLHVHCFFLLFCSGCVHCN